MQMASFQFWLLLMRLLLKLERCHLVTGWILRTLTRWHGLVTFAVLHICIRIEDIPTGGAVAAADAAQLGT